MSFTVTDTYLHPLELYAGEFIERKTINNNNNTACRRRLSISSDLSDPFAVTNEDEDKEQQLYHQNWDEILAQFDSQPEIVQLIKLCKAEEDRREQEENNMKIKEYQVLCHLQNLQQQYTSSPLDCSRKEFQLQSPPVSRRCSNKY